MKKFWIIGLFMGALVACDPLTENPESILTQESFFNTPADAVAAVNSAYRPLNQGTLYGVQLVALADLASDDVYANPGEPNASVHELNEFRPTSANAYCLNIWSNSYLSIMRANTVLDRAPNVQPANSALANRAMAEARFLRALNLFNLTRLFGDVPMPLTGTRSIEGLDLPRTPQAKVYEQIIDDFTKAASGLPATYAGPDIGRPTSWAAKGILTKVYLYRKDWDKVIAGCEEIIASNRFRLWANFEDAFKVANKNGSESLYEIQFKGPGLTQGNGFLQFCMPRNGVLGPGFGVPYPTPDLLATFETGDTRLAATVFNTWVRNGVRVNFTPMHFRKFLDEAAVNGGYNGDSDLNFPVLRYADVLLMYAEALNEKSGPDPKAINAVNQVRRRAKLTDTPASTQATLREAIYKERRLELVNESNRWFDLVRTGRLIDRVKAAKTTGVPRPAAATDKNFLMPIPQRDIDANPNLTQNPGY